MGRTKSDKNGLQPRQYKFCEYYLQTGVASTAYVKAGYSQSNKYSGSSELMTNPKVREYIRRAKRSMATNFLISKQNAQKLLTKLAKGQTKEEVVFNQQIYDDSGNLKSIDAQIVKKRVDGRVQMAAVKEVMRIYDEIDDNNFDVASTDDKLHQAMKNRIGDSLKLQSEEGLSYEEDEAEPEEDSDDNDE